MVSSDFNFWNNKNVLITGHTGFKGSWLSLLLNRLGANIYGLSLPLSPANRLFNDLNLQRLIYKSFSFCITNSNLVEECVLSVKPDIIFHLAAQPLVRESYLNPLQTFLVNTQGTANILDASRRLNKNCSIVVITTDKVYKNTEKDYSFREDDPLGGYDPYSASKAAAELIISSYIDSFSCLSTSAYASSIRIASARSGNVVGGGDWADNRILPDVIRSLDSGLPIHVRNPMATRPWQHVLEPLDGYLTLAKSLYLSSSRPDIEKYSQSFNFSPLVFSNRTVEDLLLEVFKIWPGTFEVIEDPEYLHEAQKLSLQSDKAYKVLGWSPRWSFETTIERTVTWYRNYLTRTSSPLDSCLSDIEFFYS